MNNDLDNIPNKTPVNNMVAKRQVGCINYKLKIKGSADGKLLFHQKNKAQSYNLTKIDSTIGK